MNVLARSLLQPGLQGLSSALRAKKAIGKPPAGFVPKGEGVFTSLGVKESSLLIEICGSLLQASSALTKFDYLVCLEWEFYFVS